MRLRPNRVQPAACRAAIAAALGDAAAEALLRDSGVAALPAQLPAGPRDAAALATELQPFVDLYRLLLARSDRTTALAIMRRAIIDSGLTSHGADAQSGAVPPSDAAQPLVLTSPPPAGFSATPAALAEGFQLAMAAFSCTGELLDYRPERVQFIITSCNWCSAMHAAQAPELIAFFCETDERFMDHHPTHRLLRPSAIGTGGSCCDFQFVPREPVIRKGDEETQ